MCTLHLQNWKCNIPLLSFPQGLRFVDGLDKSWTEHSFDSQVFDPECKKWVLLLLRLVDVTKEHPEVHLQSFLGKSTLMVVKKYRDDITKHVSAKDNLIAECLSVRLIIVQPLRPLVGP